MPSIGWNYTIYFLAAMAAMWIGLTVLHNRARRDREPFDRAVPGVARVLKIGKTTESRSYGAMVMDLLLQIHRPGIEPYELSTIWSVQASAVANVQVGQTFAIKVDPQDRTKVFSGEKWAHNLGVMKTPME